MYSIIIPIGLKTQEVKRYDSLRAFNIALSYYRKRCKIEVWNGIKSITFIDWR